jgi:Truncated hemoglobins
MPSPYELLGGDAGIRRLAEAFYDAMDEMPQAAGIRRMHADDLSEVKQKLYEYLSGWLGGPRLYYEKYGTVCLVGVHHPYRIGPAERDQWLQCMEEALKRVGVDGELRSRLLRAFFQMADFLRTDDGSAD